MPKLVDPTELLAVDPDEAHYVMKPANGFSPILAKAEGEVDEVLTVAGAAALAAKRNGEKIFKDTGREAHDSPSYQAMSRPPFPESDEDKPNSSINGAGAPNGAGFGNPEVDALLLKAVAVVKQAETLSEALEALLARGKAQLRKDSPLFMVMDPASGEISIPGSPSWEAEDAERLIAIGQQLAQTITAVQASCDRESIEVSAGAADDHEDVWLLQDACYALEQALGIVSRLAFHEEAEAQSNPPEGALAKSLTESSVDAIRRSIFLAKTVGANDPAPQGSGSEEEVWDMGSLTKEDLAAVVGEAVKPISDRIDAFEKAQADAIAAAGTGDAPVETEAEKLAKAEAEKRQADGEQFIKELIEWDTAAKAAEAAAAPATQSTEELGALLKSVVEEAIAPLNERLVKVEATPVVSGLMSGAGGAGLPAGPRDAAGGADDPTVTSEMKDLQDKIQKAEAAGDVNANERYRKALGQRVLEVAWAGMGYPTATPTTRQAQYTENAPSAMAR